MANSTCVIYNEVHDLLQIILASPITEGHHFSSNASCRNSNYFQAILLAASYIAIKRIARPLFSTWEREREKIV